MGLIDCRIVPVVVESGSKDAEYGGYGWAGEAIDDSGRQSAACSLKEEAASAVSYYPLQPTSHGSRICKAPTPFRIYGDRGREEARHAAVGYGVL